MKEATANIERNSDLIRRAPRNFAIYSGDDATCLALILLGGHGLFTWGATQRECYLNSIKTIDQMGEFVQEHATRAGTPRRISFAA
mgnify:CR=1 FL=1